MKKTKLLLISVISLTLLSGCFKRDNMDNINIYATVYPVEYLIENIYGYNSNIDSIYPNGVNVFEYELTDKQIKEYSETDMFIYNGATSEKKIAANFLNNNKDLKIIDVAKNISMQRDQEELWLCPTNYLMLAQNIKNELTGYVNSTILKQEILEKYDAIKLTISKYDAELKLIAENAKNKTIIAGNDVFMFLEKYGFKVISIEENDNYVASNFQDAKNAITNKSVSNIFILDTDKESENVKKLISSGGKVVKVKSMINLTDKEKEDNIDYPKMMVEFINQIKTEVYN